MIDTFSWKDRMNSTMVVVYVLDLQLRRHNELKQPFFR